MTKGIRDEPACPSCGRQEVRPEGYPCTLCGWVTGDGPATTTMARKRPDPTRPATTEGRVAIPREGSARRSSAKARRSLDVVPGPTGPIEENDMATMDYTPCGLPVPGTKQTCMRKQKHHDACRTTLTDPVKAAKRQEQMAARLARQETEDVIESVVTATKATPETRMKVAKRVAAVAK